jgi:uncharacterized Tic20 family protein
LDLAAEIDHVGVGERLLFLLTRARRSRRMVSSSRALNASFGSITTGSSLSLLLFIVIVVIAVVSTAVSVVLLLLVALMLVLLLELALQLVLVLGAAVRLANESEVFPYSLGLACAQQRA